MPWGSFPSWLLIAILVSACALTVTRARAAGFTGTVLGLLAGEGAVTLDTRACCGFNWWCSVLGEAIVR